MLIQIGKCLREGAQGSAKIGKVRPEAGQECQAKGQKKGQRGRDECADEGKLECGHPYENPRKIGGKNAGCLGQCRAAWD